MKQIVSAVSVLLLIGCGQGDYEIEVLSSRPHLVSGGDTLVRVTAPEGTAILLNGVDVSEAFHPYEDGLLGVVEGLREGANTLEAGESQLELTNYPITGPMISGPHEEPFVCGVSEINVALTGESLGDPLDEDCSAPTRVDYVYMSTDGEFCPLPARERPEDIAETTTMDGRTVPFLVRVETGTINRAIYESAMLHDPADPTPDPWTRSAGWNGKLVYTHGGGCQSGWYVQGDRTGGVLREGFLADGYAVTSSSLNVFGQSCSDLLASETHIMVKERFVEAYGPPIYTVGTGCSGGSYQSHQTADNYPGVFDGIIVNCSFPDVISATAAKVADVRLLRYYFEHTGPGLFSDDEQKAVAGFREWGNLSRLSQMAARIDPVSGEATEPEEQGGEVKDDPALREARYDPAMYPGGIRATVFDHAVNVYGKDQTTGFARRPLDNVGVQYGLGALTAGKITKEQFLRLNEGIGGYDADANHVPGRHTADPYAAKMARGTGRVLYGGAGLATTPVIDYRTYTDDREEGDSHMIVHQFSTRARMTKRNGHADNHVMVVGGRWGFTEDEPDLRMLFHRMDEWLMNIREDVSTSDRAAKVVNNKPAGLEEGCWDNRTEPRLWIPETLAYHGSGACAEIYPAFATPRIVAGAPLADDILKCQLKPIAASEYEVEFTPEELTRLQTIFPDGVCNWDQPGQYEGYEGTWLSFGPSPVNRVE